jgi:ABC-type transport system involved in multi-copper enzyme maturation permease subunit
MTQYGAWFSAGVAAFGLIAALLVGGGGLALAGILKNVLMFAYAGGADEALALVAVVALFNLAGFLIAQVGIRARDLWALPLPFIIAAANILLVFAWGFTFGIAFAALGILSGIAAARAWRAFRVNPVALKELRGRMRGARAFIVLGVYLALMSAFALLIYLAFNAGSRFGSSVAGEIGRALFLSVVAIELLLILFIAPALTSGAITGERERQTYDLLRTTLLTPPTFVMGKLESALAYLLLLLFAAVPLQSIAFLFGGVSEGEILLAFLILVVTALALGAIGIFFSAAMQRTVSANVRAYLLILGLMFFTPLVIGAILNVLSRALFTPGSAFALPLLETFVAYLSAIMTAINPVTAALTTQQALIERQTIGFYPYTLASTGGTIPMISPWALFTAIYLTMAALLILWAIRRTKREELAG